MAARGNGGELQGGYGGELQGGYGGELQGGYGGELQGGLRYYAITLLRIYSYEYAYILLRILYNVNNISIMI
jgi:hypothetical protein